MTTVPVVLISALVAVLVSCEGVKANFGGNRRDNSSPRNYLPLPPPPPQPCGTLCSRWSQPPLGVTGMTLEQQGWYLRQGFPTPVVNRFALGYQNHHGVGMYKVHRESRSWNDALDICANEGSILAVINDAREAEILKTLIIGASGHHNEVTTSGMYFYWIGAKEFGTKMQFYTLHGDILGSDGYLRWSPSNSQPDNYGNYDCVGFMHDGKNFDANCSERLGFICEKVT